MDIGQTVKVIRLRERVAQDIISRLGQIGQVKELKVVDGSDIGAIVQFEDGFATWFFPDELREGA